MNRRYIPEKKKHVTRKKSFKISYSVVAFLVCILTIPFLVRISGHLLVQDDEYKNVQCALLVTAEGSLESGYNALLEDIKAIDIERVILSGSRILKTVSTADIVLNELKYENFDKDRLFYFYHDAQTLIGEAEYIIPFLRKKGVDTVVVYTSKQMSSRVKNIYNTMAEGNPYFLVSYSTTEIFNPKSWIHNTESRKLWAEEWPKNLFNRIELLFNTSLDNDIKVYNYQSGYSVRTKDSEVEIDDSLLEEIPSGGFLSSADMFESSTSSTLSIEQSLSVPEDSNQ